MKVYRATAGPSWPDLVADRPLKIGTNSIRDMIRRGVVECRLHTLNGEATTEGAVAAGNGLLSTWYAELSMPELARLAALHGALVTLLSLPPAERRQALRDMGERPMAGDEPGGAGL